MRHAGHEAPASFARSPRARRFIIYSARAVVRCCANSATQPSGIYLPQLPDSRAACPTSFLLLHRMLTTHTVHTRLHCTPRLPPGRCGAPLGLSLGVTGRRRAAQPRDGSRLRAAPSASAAASALEQTHDLATGWHQAALHGPLAELAALDPATAGTAALVLGPLLSVGTLLFIVRIVMTWYPDIKDDAFPWSIVYVPTEPLLAPTRKLITPVGCALSRRHARAHRSLTLACAAAWTSRPSCGWLSSASPTKSCWASRACSSCSALR